MENQQRNFFHFTRQTKVKLCVNLFVVNYIVFICVNESGKLSSISVRNNISFHKNWQSKLIIALLISLSKKWVSLERNVKILCDICLKDCTFSYQISEI